MDHVEQLVTQHVAHLVIAMGYPPTVAVIFFVPSLETVVMTTLKFVLVVFLVAVEQLDTLLAAKMVQTVLVFLPTASVTLIVEIVVIAALEILMQHVQLVSYLPIIVTIKLRMTKSGKVFNFAI